MSRCSASPTSAPSASPRDRRPPAARVLELTLNTEAGASHTLQVFARQGNSYPATSSGSDYPFLLFVWMVNGFLEAFTTAGPPEE